MSMWKQIFLVLFFICAMYFGGLSTQSNSSLMQGFGFVVIIIAFGLLYVISKVMWRAMGFMTSFFIIGSVVIFILYCLGLLGKDKSLKEFVSGTSPAVEMQANMPAPVESGNEGSDPFDFMDLETELAAGSGGSQTVDGEEIHEVSAQPEETAVAEPEAAAEVPTQAQPKPMQQPTQPVQQSAQPMPRQIQMPQQQGSSEGFFDKIMNFFGVSDDNGESGAFNPTDYPYVEGYARVVTASVLKIGRYYIKMLGIDAPDPRQTCADKHGSSYACGKRALTWLQNWINNRPIRCYVVGNVVHNRTTGVCFTQDGKYDLAAVVTNAGWALAWTQNTDVYVPYERQAAQNRRGLWEGRFYKPWDWRKIQNRRANIKINKTNSSGGFFDFLDGWF